MALDIKPGAKLIILKGVEGTLWIEIHLTAVISLKTTNVNLLKLEEKSVIRQSH